MTLEQNKQKMFYSLQGEEIPIYETDSDGNIIYYEESDGNRIPLETGETEIGYSEPVEFFSNIAMSGGEAEAQEYGNQTRNGKKAMFQLRKVALFGLKVR